MEKEGYQNCGKIAGRSRISLIAQDAIRNGDLTKEDAWHKTLLQLKKDGVRGNIAFVWHG